MAEVTCGGGNEIEEAIEQNDDPAIDFMIMLPLSFFFIIVELSPSTYVPSASELNQSFLCSSLEIKVSDCIKMIKVNMSQRRFIYLHFLFCIHFIISST